MRNRRYDKRDQSELKSVEALEKAGWEVHRDLDVDLLCLKRVTPEKLLHMATTFDDGTVLAIVLLESKTAYGKRNPKAVLDKRQVKQNAFTERWKILKPTTPVEALIAAGETVEIT
jgi:hypothetical protein